MKKEEVKLEVIGIIVESYQVSRDKITEDSFLEKDLKFDELDMVEFVMTLEEVLGIEIPDEDGDKHFYGHTVGSVIDYIVEKTKDRQGE